jgi:uroporphyrinogen decarboxylase
MTKRELVIKTLAHNNPGKIPQAIDLTGEACDLYGDRLLADYHNEQVRRDLEAGVISKSQAISLSIGNNILFVYPPWWNWYNLTDVFLKEPYPPDYLPGAIGYGSYEEFFNKIFYIKKHYDVYLIATIWENNWERAKTARGIENFLTDLAGSPEWAKSLLDLIISKSLVMLENILDVPELDGVLLGSDWGTQRDLFMSPDCFRTMLKQGEKQEYDLIKKHGKQVWVHSCGNILRIMEDLVELGVDCLNPVQPECMDLEFLKKTYGDCLSFYGGISTQQTLPRGTPAEVRSETRRVTELMSREGGYIISPSQHIQIDVPYDNLKALIDTAGEYWR